VVVKKNNERRPFDRDKMARSINLAVRKRSISQEEIDLLVNNIIRKLETMGESEIPSSLIGEMIMEALAKLDQVAYVRFASVYRDFCEAKDFEKFVEQLKARKHDQS
jgi:transcriptional repressor NrdR